MRIGKILSFVPKAKSSLIMLAVTPYQPMPNMALNRSAVIMRFCFFSFPCRARLALRYMYLVKS